MEYRGFRGHESLVLVLVLLLAVGTIDSDVPQCMRIVNIYICVFFQIGQGSRTDPYQ